MTTTAAAEYAIDNGGWPLKRLCEGAQRCRFGKKKGVDKPTAWPQLGKKDRSRTMRKESAPRVRGES